MWLLMDPPQPSLVLGQVGPPKQPLLSNLFLQHQTLPTKVFKIKVRAQIGTSGLHPPEVVVCQEAAREIGTEAVVVGTVRPTQGRQGEGVTPIQGNRVLLMCPLVGMEAAVVTAGVRGMVQPIALGAIHHFQALSEPVPSAMLLFAKVILMRAVDIVHSVSNWVKKY